MLEFLDQTFYGNKISAWAISLGIFFGSIVVAKICYWIIGKYVKKLTAKTKTNLDDLLVDKLEEPVVYAIGIIGFYWAFQYLKFGEGVDNFFVATFTIVFTLNVTWLLVRTLDAIIEEYLTTIVSKSESDLDDQLLPLVRKLLNAILWALGLVIGLNNVGFDVTALIAGLGIGGLALALAAQDTVKNIFGGLMVYLDKPFKVKDRININGFDGVVEEVGIRSTRIRTLEGRVVTLPNAQFSDNPVENISVEPSRKIVINLGLTYETSPEKMERAIQLLDEIAGANENLEENRLISFNNWGDFSMGILFIYYIKSGADILKTQTEINMEILRKFNTEGLDFAYPTQMVYKKEVQ